MKKHKLGFLWLVICFPLVLFACQQEQEAPAVEKAIVEANQAYLQHFGDPPPVKEGKAHAVVGYLPLEEDPEKVAALPMFLFAKENMLENVLSKLISGELTLNQKTRFYHPFPKDLDLAVQSIDNGILSLDLITSEAWSEENQIATRNSLVETALQFEDVEAVMISLNGTDFAGMPPRGFQHNEQLIAAMLPPALILMVGVWEAGEDAVEELLIQFDRPVQIESFKLYHQDGRKLEGDYFTSIFQMAVVVHPQAPRRLSEGMMLKAEWSVVDFRGMKNSGTDIMSLRKYLH